VSPQCINKRHCTALIYYITVYYHNGALLAKKLLGNSKSSDIQLQVQ